MMLHDEVIKLGWNEKHPHLCFCQEVARRADEMGNEYPSDDAIQIAMGMVDAFRTSTQTVRNENE